MPEEPKLGETSTPETSEGAAEAQETEASTPEAGEAEAKSLESGIPESGTLESGDTLDGATVEGATVVDGGEIGPTDAEDSKPKIGVPDGDSVQVSDGSPASELARYPTTYEVETDAAGNVVAVEAVMVELGGYLVNLGQAKAAIYTAKRDILEIIKDQVVRAARRSGTSLEGIAGDVIPPVPGNLNFKFNGLINALQGVSKRETDSAKEVIREIQSVILAREATGK